ncbi:MAG: transposase, partial [Legionellales bacterium]|nr:transposase [Legionellales bacterium]
FNRPTWKKIQTLLIGAILCRGPRRVTSILRVMNLGQERNFSKYHRVLNHASWNGIALSKILLGLLIKLIPESWPILVAVDETLERRKGKMIKAKGVYRDAVRSSQSHLVTSYGLKWECMTLIVPLPWCRRSWALPFLTVLSPSKKSNEAAGRRHKTSIDWTRQMVILISRWLNKAAWILVGDGAYACMALAQTCIDRNVTLLSRLRLDAQLFEFPVHLPKKLGRKPVKGKRIELRKLLEDPKQTWVSLNVNWYGGIQKTIECLSFTCLWYHAGEPPVTLRIVLVKTPDGKNSAETFFSTDITLEPVQIINWFILRWNIEVTFAETRMHLGVETQRQWSDKAIHRTTPLLMALYSLLTLIALEMNKKKALVVAETTSWYDKKGELTFTDIILAVRRSLWSIRFSKSENGEDSLKIINQNTKYILDQLALAA